MISTDSKGNAAVVAPVGFLVYLAKELARVLGGLGIQEDWKENGRWGIEGLEFD